MAAWVGDAKLIVWILMPAGVLKQQIATGTDEGRHACVLGTLVHAGTCGGTSRHGHAQLGAFQHPDWRQAQRGQRVWRTLTLYLSSHWPEQPRHPAVASPTISSHLQMWPACSSVHHFLGDAPDPTQHGVSISRYLEHVSKYLKYDWNHT